MILPTDSGEFEVSLDLIESLKRKFVQIDVMDELYKMYLWLQKNPSRRPKLPIRFIERWLSKATPKVTKLKVIGGKITEQEILIKAKGMGIEARPGETYEKLYQRIRAIERAGMQNDSNLTNRQS